MPYKNYADTLACMRRRYWKKRKSILAYGKVWRRRNKRHCRLVKRKYFRRFPERRVWKGMKERCYGKRHPYYKDYGGRGIKILYGSFEEFIADVGLRPTPKHEIDRINNDGNYEPGNCRWVTHKENCNNRRNSKCKLKLSKV